MAHRIEHKQTTLIELLIEEVLMSWSTKESVVVSLRLLEYVFPLPYQTFMSDQSPWAAYKNRYLDERYVPIACSDRYM